MNQKSWNIDNVYVNRTLVPIVFLAYLVYSWLTNPNSITNTNGIKLSFVSCIIYFYVSRFFQPDLDQTPHRPGNLSFPVSMEALSFIGNTIEIIVGIRKKRTINLCLLIIRPVAFVWYIIWEPYALLLTHRGISHWPIIGTLSRLYYLSLICLVPGFEYLFEYFRPFLLLDLSDKRFVVYYVSPIYLSDVVHISVDFLESKVKGYDFCTPKNKRGYISIFLQKLKIKITI